MDELLAPEVIDVAAEVLGAAAISTDWHTEPVLYDSGSPATGGLSRVRGKARMGALLIASFLFLFLFAACLVP